MTKLQEKLVSYADMTIENRCEYEGPNRVLPGLLEFGFTKKELIKMHFDEDAIDLAIKELEEQEAEEGDSEED